MLKHGVYKHTQQQIKISLSKQNKTNIHNTKHILHITHYILHFIIQYNKINII